MTDLLLNALTVVVTIGLVCVALGLASIVSEMLGVDEWL